MLVKEFLKSFLVALIIMLVFFSNPAFAYKLENPSTSLFFADTITTPDGTTSTTSTTNSSTLPSLTPTTPTSSGTCVVSKLSPKEAQDILDIAHSGFSGDTLTDGSAPDKNKLTDLNGTQLVAKDNDGNKAIKVTPPTQALSAEKFSAFDGRDISGPFGIGLVLDDTLRVGMCKYPTEDQSNCRIEGAGTQYRTSGVGLTENTFNALDSVKQALDRKAAGVTEEEYQKMQNGLLDSNQNTSFTLSVSPSDKIKNSFLTENYNIKKSTNCNGSTCIISTYSSFDKYFNSWFSAEMVVSSFGPTLLNKASKLMPFGGNSDAKWLNKTGKFFDKWIDKSKKLPLEMYGDTRLASWKRRLINNPELKQFNDKFTIQAKLFSTEGGGLFTDMWKEGSEFRKMSPESKQEFYKAFDDLRSWIREENARVQSNKAAFDTLLKTPGITQAEKEAATIEFGQQMASTMVRYDDETALDFVQWVKDSGSLGDMAQLNFKRTGFGEGTGVVNMAADKPFNLKQVMQVFKDNGNWKSYENSALGEALETDALGNLVLYEIRPNKLVQSAVSVDDLTKYLAKQQGAGTLSVRIPTTNQTYELNEATVGLLKSNPNMAATVDIVTGDWAPKLAPDGTVQVLTPLEFSERLTQKRMISRPATAERNATNFYNMMRNDPEFAARRSWSLYDAQISKEKNFLVDYFKQPLQTGLWKGTALPIAYWNVKRGLGFEQVSGYMLPDTWTTIEIQPGSEEIYRDSYTDLYANEGSDQGDLFMKMLNQGVFVYKYIADQFTKEEFPWFHDWLTRVSGSSEGVATGSVTSKSITRDKVQDIAFYSHNENCSGCSINLKQNNGYLTLTGHMPTNIQAFVVEAVDSTTAQKEGTTLIAYTHHADIVGKTANVPGSAINIANARAQETTCEQQLADLPGIGFALKKADPRLVGGVLAVGESLGYAMGFGYGITATAFQQLLLSRGLQDCVDDKDGYYVHLFSPPASTKVVPKEQVSNETMSDAIKNLSDKVTAATTNSNSPIAESLDKIKQDAQAFANSAKKDDVLQANIQLSPPTVGEVTGKEVFYVWYSGQSFANPVEYKTEGQQIITDGNKKVEFNFNDGTLKYNGKEVLGTDKADHTRLATTPSDNRIPGIVVPMTLNKVAAPNTSETVFELHSGGDIVVRNSEVLDCIQKAIKDQSGISYSGDELTQVFGKLQGINTEVYQKIFAENSKIYLEGSGPRVQGGIGSNFVIDGYWNSRLVVDANQVADAGKFKGMAFEYGTIVLKPETNEIIIWLRQHKEAILSNQEVSGLKGKLTSVADPNNGCDTPAVTLAATGQPGDELGQQRVRNFNTSMEHLGPFTQFITDSKIYEFYTVKDPTTSECKQYFRIIDKNSGNVLYDGEIKGGVTQDENGKLSFTTADGQKHSLDFSAENGVPMVSYNGGPKETLRAAQGPNGSFWYDPTTGLWYPENGLQIPLSQAFKDNGTMYASDGKGGVVGTPTNPMTFNIGGQTGQGLNIPSLPETAAGLIVFIGAFLIVSFILTQRKRKL